MIKEKALMIQETLVQEGNWSSPYILNHAGGWLERFKHWLDLQNIVLASEARSVDTDAANNFMPISL